MTFGAFLTVLNNIAAAINADASLHPVPSFSIGAIPNNPTTHQPFAEEFYPKSIDALSSKITQVLRGAPYNL